MGADARRADLATILRTTPYKRSMGVSAYGPSPFYEHDYAAMADAVLGYVNNAVAQAGAERDEDRHLRVQLSEDSQRHVDKIVQLRAALARLREIVAGIHAIRCTCGAGPVRGAELQGLAGKDGP